MAEQQTQSLELIGESEEPALFWEPTISTIGQLRRETGRRLGHYLIVIMCVGGMIVVWLYSSGKGFFNLSQLSNLVPETGVQSAFANPLQVGIMSIVAMTMALWVALRRRASRLRAQL